MRSILLALVALPQWGSSPARFAGARSLTDTHAHTANKSDEFVNIIKDDLRRNNDDYVMPEERSQAPPTPHALPASPAPPAPPTPLAPPAPRPPRSRVFPPAQPPVRRMQPSFGQPGALPQQPRQPGPLPQQPHRPGALPQQPRQPEPLPQQPSQPGPLPQQPRQSGPPPNQVGQVRRHLEPLPHRQPHKLFLEARRSLNLTKKHTSMTLNLIASKSHTRSTRYKHLRINKLKRLLDKRTPTARTLLPTAATTESPTPSPPPRPSPSPAVTTTAKSPTTAPHTTSHLARTKHLTLFEQEEQEQQQEPVMRQKPDEVTSPSPDELDMAPARGAQITHIRYKGRLCQRNLMNMEGPSYDKAGNEVNPAHHPSNSRGRRFYQTRPPKLVLPRCCNCCKKSVLGCQ